MNERIAKLYDRAIIIEDGGDYVCGKLDPVKFAELMVRECIDTMYKRGEAYAHPSAGFYQAKTFSEAIMEHFGVTE